MQVVDVGGLQDQLDLLQADHAQKPAFLIDNRQDGVRRIGQQPDHLVERIIGVDAP